MIIYVYCTHMLYMCTVLKHAILDINGEKSICKKSACFTSPAVSLSSHFGLGTEVAGLTRLECTCMWSVGWQKQAIILQSHMCTPLCPFGKLF